MIDFDKIDGEIDTGSSFFQAAYQLADKITRSQGGGYHMFYGVDKTTAAPLFDSINLLTADGTPSFVCKMSNVTTDGKNKVDMFCDARHFIYEWEPWDNTVGLTDKTQILYELIKENFELKRPMSGGKIGHASGKRGNGVKDYAKVSPYKLLINEGNYYLLAFDDKAQDMRTYRIDRMKEVKVLSEPREGAEVFSKVDMETYTRRVFSMFGGERKRVSIRFINPLLDTAVERFGAGPDVFYRRDDEKHFVVTADVEISNQFFAWVCGFRKGAAIVSPPDVVENMKKFLEDVGARYQVAES